VYHAASGGLKAPSFYNDGVGLSLQPDRLKRFKEVARLLYKYGKTDLVSRASLNDALAGETLTPADQSDQPDELAADLERLGPAAAAGALWLAFTILSSDRQTRQR